MPRPRIDYHAYLESDEWQARRAEALDAAFYACRACGVGRGLQVHHKTYKNLGCERPEDLEVLCDECHREEHEHLAQRRRSEALMPATLSRYGASREEAEMQHFVHELKVSGYAHAVKSLFYDGQSCCCEIELRPRFEQDVDAWVAVEAAAKSALSQYSFRDCVGHGGAREEHP